MQHNYHSRKYDGNSVVRVRAQVMMRDDSTGGWVPMGGGGISNVSVRKRKIHHEENDQPCKHEYLIYGKRISDQSVVLSCTIKKDFEYNKVMPTFHHWKTGNKKFGLTFRTAADARAFDKGVRLAIEDLLDGISETSPLHQYNLDVGDDDVFMQLDLPVDKSVESGRSPNSTGRSPSPLDSHFLHHHHMPVTVSKSASPPHSATSPPLKPPLKAVSSEANGSGFTTHMVHFPPPPKPSPQQQQLPSAKLLADHHMMHHVLHKSSPAVAKDKDYSYVKFPRREPPHEYSYPKLIDAYKESSKGVPTKDNSSNSSCNSSSSISKDLKDVKSSCNSSSCSNVSDSKKCSNSVIQGSEGGSASGVGVCAGNNDPIAGLHLAGASSALVRGPAASAAGNAASMTLTCAHCRESFSRASNRRGACAYAPDDCARKAVETATCLQCAKCLLYHCMSDAEGDYGGHPCECANTDGHWARRWIGLTLLSILVPCLCCYVPLMACYRCGAACSICGGRHEAS